MITTLESQPNASAVLGAVIDGGGEPSHAYLFHGPGGSGKRRIAREFAAALLSAGAVDPAGAQARALAGTHPDLTWVVPSGAHEMLVSDIDEAVIAAVSLTPFESARRVFVIEGADQLGDDAANRMLKTLEEPPGYVHIVLIAKHLQRVLPTIRSRCQLVRFDPPSEDELVAELVGEMGLDATRARACARLGLGEGDVARTLADENGAQLRERSIALVRRALAGTASGSAPWSGLLEAVGREGESVEAELEAKLAVELEFYPKRERARIETEWRDRIKRARRRSRTAMLSEGLTLAQAWLLDLAALEWGAEDAVRNVDLRAELEVDRAVGRGADPGALCEATRLIEETRQRLALNVGEELACEALTYRIEEVLSR